MFAEPSTTTRSTRPVNLDTNCESLPSLFVIPDVDPRPIKNTPDELLRRQLGAIELVAAVHQRTKKELYNPISKFEKLDEQFQRTITLMIEYMNTFKTRVNICSVVNDMYMWVCTTKNGKEKTYTRRSPCINIKDSNTLRTYGNSLEFVVNRVAFNKRYNESKTGDATSHILVNFPLLLGIHFAYESGTGATYIDAKKPFYMGPNQEGEFARYVVRSIVDDKWNSMVVLEKTENRLD